MKTVSAKPEYCTKLFIRNLNYNITTNGIMKFFPDVDADIKLLRWLDCKDTCDFKGVGVVFCNNESSEKGDMLNRKNLIERPIQIDWTK